jgi:hypothetical protein
MNAARADYGLRDAFSWFDESAVPRPVNHLRRCKAGRFAATCHFFRVDKEGISAHDGFDVIAMPAPC